jgi:hypothetical protein
MPKLQEFHFIAQRQADMAEVIAFAPGGYRYIKGVFQYSAGVAAEPGYEIERVRMPHPRPLAEGFAAAAAWIKAAGRPLTSFCACELRSPAPFSETGFTDFNRQYVTTLQQWGIYKDDINPVARTNVCPVYAPPSVPSMHAFSFTVPAALARRKTFIIAGGGEAKEGRPNYRDTIVRLGDTSPEGMRDKVRYVASEMEARLAALGFCWADAISVQAYTMHDLGPLLGEELVRRCGTDAIDWNFCRPPIVNLEYEMDVRGAAREAVLQ